jgi:hypothetical protein
LGTGGAGVLLVDVPLPLPPGVEVFKVDLMDMLGVVYSFWRSITIVGSPVKWYA